MLEATLTQHFGFIGLGAMGFPMALNLAKKVPGLKTINIYDVSADSLKRAAAAAADCFNACSSAKEVAEKSVRSLPFLLSCSPAVATLPALNTTKWD